MTTEAHRTLKTIIHFAPTERKLRLLDPMCGYVGPADDISTDQKLCTCPECRDWIATRRCDK